MIARTTLAIGLVWIVGCGSKPPPRSCSTEAPPAEPKDGPIEIGMCPMDPAPDGGATEASAPDAPPDATNGGG